MNKVSGRLTAVLLVPCLVPYPALGMFTAWAGSDAKTRYVALLDQEPLEPFETPYAEQALAVLGTFIGDPKILKTAGQWKPNARSRALAMARQAQQRATKPVAKRSFTDLELATSVLPMREGIDRFRWLIARKFDEIRDRAVLVGLYGSPGCGKSTFAGQLARSDDRIAVIGLDIQFGLLGEVVQRLREAQQNPRVRVILIDGYDVPLLRDIAIDVHLTVLITADAATRRANLTERQFRENSGWAPAQIQRHIENYMNIETYPDHQDLILDNSNQFRWLPDESIRLLPGESRDPSGTKSHAAGALADEQYNNLYRGDLLGRGFHPRKLLSWTIAVLVLGLALQRESMAQPPPRAPAQRSEQLMERGA